MWRFSSANLRVHCTEADAVLLQGSEVENPDAAMTRKPDDAEPFSGLAFKIMADPFVGTLTFVRIYRCDMLPSSPGCQHSRPV